MSYRPRLTVVLALVLAIAMLASACGTSELVVTEGALADPTPGPVESQPEVTEQVKPEEVEPTPIEVEPPEPTPDEAPDEQEPEEPMPVDASTSSLAGAALLSEASASAGQGSYRFEVFLSMAFAGGPVELNFAGQEPLSIGLASDRTQSMSINLGPFSEAMSGLIVTPVVLNAHLVETIVDGATMYVRAPLLERTVRRVRADLASELAPLGSAWGVVDLEVLTGFDTSNILALVNGPTIFSLEQMLALLEPVGGEVREIGKATVRGVETTHVRTEVSLLDLMGATGFDLDPDEGFRPQGPDFAVPFDLFIDADERIRRVSAAISLDDLLRLAPEDQELSEVTNFEYLTTIDLFDFGADITIDVPSEDEIVGDFTDLFAELAALAD